MTDTTDMNIDQLTVNPGRGERIAQCRLAMGLTQQELAAKTGIATGIIHDLENGGILGTGENVVLLAQTFGVYALWLVTGLGEQKISGPRYAVAVERPPLPPEPTSH